MYVNVLVPYIFYAYTLYMYNISVNYLNVQVACMFTVQFFQVNMQGVSFGIYIYVSDHHPHVHTGIYLHDK